MNIVGEGRSQCRLSGEVSWSLIMIITGARDGHGRRQEVSVYAWENINDSNSTETTGQPRTAQVIKLWTSHQLVAIQQ